MTFESVTLLYHRDNSYSQGKQIQANKFTKETIITNSRPNFLAQTKHTWKDLYPRQYSFDYRRRRFFRRYHRLRASGCRANPIATASTPPPTPPRNHKTPPEPTPIRPPRIAPFAHKIWPWIGRCESYDSVQNIN